VKNTIVASALGLSLALNASLLLGHVKRSGSSLPALAAPAPSQPRCLLDAIDLDDGQRDRLSKLRREMRPKRAAYWKRARAIKAELANAVADPNADRARVDRLVERYGENQESMQREVAAHLMNVNDLLRPDQRDHYRALLRDEMFRGIQPRDAGVEAEP